MVKYSDFQHSETIELEEYYEFVRSNIDVRDDESLFESAFEFSKLRKNDNVFFNLVEEGLKDFASFHATSLSSAQTLELPTPSIDDCTARFAIWGTPTVEHKEAEWYSYGLVHNHNFSFLTQTVLGPGYRTEIYEIEPNSPRIFGSQVKISNREDLIIHPGRVLLYEGDTDVHVQHPVSELSVTLNFLVSRPKFDQYVYDAGKNTVLNQIAGEGCSIAKLVSIALSINDESLDGLLLDTIRNHRSQNVRIYVCIEMIRKGKLEVDKALSLLGKEYQHLSSHLRRVDEISFDA